VLCWYLIISTRQEGEIKHVTQPPFTLSETEAWFVLFWWVPIIFPRRYFDAKSVHSSHSSTWSITSVEIEASCTFSNFTWGRKFTLFSSIAQFQTSTIENTPWKLFNVHQFLIPTYIHNYICQNRQLPNFVRGRQNINTPESPVSPANPPSALEQWLWITCDLNGDAWSRVVLLINEISMRHIETLDWYVHLALDFRRILNLLVVSESPERFGSIKCHFFKACEEILEEWVPFSE